MYLKVDIKKRLKTNPYIRLLAEQKKTKEYRKKANTIPDYEFIVEMYRKTTGNELNLSNPQRYTEKLQWLKLFWRDERATICANKYTVKSYLEELGYGYLLNETIGYYTDIEELSVDELPDCFVLKGTHGSGWNLIVKDKKKVDWKIWKKIMKCWLDQDLSWYGREWVYRDQPHGIIVEKYLEDDSGELRDFKIICANGNPLFMQIDENRSTNHKRIYVDSTGKAVPMDDDQESKHPNIQFGPLQVEMFRLAKVLSSSFPYVRVDFYECNGKIYFGEFTFFGASGFFRFEPDKWDYIWGEKIHLPEPNYNLDLYKKLHSWNNN